MDSQDIIDAIHRKIIPGLDVGWVASYIPELARVSPSHFAMAVQTPIGQPARPAIFVLR